MEISGPYMFLKQVFVCVYAGYMVEAVVHVWEFHVGG